MKSLDVRLDPAYTHLYHILREDPALYELVKTASIPTGSEWDSLSSGDFADNTSRMYPIHDKPNTAVSVIYATTTDAPERVLNTLKYACYMHGIDYAHVAASAKVAMSSVLANAKTASDMNTTWLLPSQKMYPVRDAGDVKTASEWLLDNYDAMPDGVRDEFFTELRKYAAENDLDLDIRLYKVARQVATDTNVLRDQLLARKAVTRVASAAQAYSKLAEAVEDMPAIVSSDAQEKLAKLVDEIDEHAAFTPRQQRMLGDATRAVYNTAHIIDDERSSRYVDKFASTLIQLPGDFMIRKDKVASMDVELATAILGADIVADMHVDGRWDLEKAAEILPTIPADMANALLRVYSGYQRSQ